MRRSTAASVLIPVLLLHLLPPTSAAARTTPTDKETTRPRGYPTPRLTDKQPSRPRQPPIPRLTDKEPPRPGGGGFPRFDDGGRGGADPDRARRFRYRAPNDFLIEVVSWPDEDGGFTAAASLSSRSGERMTFDFSPDAGFGPTVLIDGTVLVSYDTARDGRVRAVSVHDGERWFQSQTGPSGDREAYLRLVETLAARHSAEFLDQMTVAMRSFETAAIAPAGLREFFECMLGITGYVISIWAIITGCTVVGVPTLGASCIVAILAHEVAAASAILGCFPR